MVLSVSPREKKDVVGLFDDDASGAGKNAKSSFHSSSKPKCTSNISLMILIQDEDSHVNQNEDQTALVGE